MNSLETGKKFVELCKEQKDLEAIDTLFSSDVVSVEPMAMAELPAQTRGVDAIRQKNKMWFDSQKVNSSSVEGPFVNGDRFSVNFKYNVTSKKSGKSSDMSEIGLYTVKNDKIVKEEFFYSP